MPILIIIDMIVGEESGARVTWAEELAPPSLHQQKSWGTQGGASAFVEMLIAESVAKAAFCSSLSTQQLLPRKGARVCACEPHCTPHSHWSC